MERKCDSFSLYCILALYNDTVLFFIGRDFCRSLIRFLFLFGYNHYRYAPMSVKKGDKVMLADWSGNTVKVNDKELLIVKEEEILGKVELA